MLRLFILEFKYASPKRHRVHFGIFIQALDAQYNRTNGKKNIIVAVAFFPRWFNQYPIQYKSQLTGLLDLI
jgi:uncharacterized membrane protein